MNKRQLIVLCLLAAGGVMQAQQWPDTPVEARPGARWWWLGSAVDEKNLTYNLEEYARTGMGAVEITPIYGVQGNDANDIQFLSPRWMEMLKHTQAEGKRTGIEIDMNTGTGWPFGGPEDAATKAIFQTYEIEGGKEIEQDINVTDPKQQPFSVLSRVMAYDEKGKCINLTAHVKKDKLQWKAPAGKWKVIALYIGKTRQKVKRAAPGGEGYVMNHLSKKAVKNYLSRFDRAFKSNKTSYPHTFFNDSYEVYQADWTDDFLEQFARRRGYKLEEHFSEIFTATLGKHLGFDMAEYALSGAYVVSRDFTEGRLNFEPMANLVQDNEEYDFNYDVLQNLNPLLLKPYLDILFMDALVFNVDRHTQNYGLLRSRETGEILSMAPNFDNNMALISRGYASDLSNIANPLIGQFQELLREKSIQYPVPKLTKETLERIVNETMPDAEIRRDYVVQFVWQNYERLCAI